MSDLASELLGGLRALARGADGRDAVSVPVPLLEWAIGEIERLGSLAGAVTSGPSLADMKSNG